MVKTEIERSAQELLSSALSSDERRLRHSNTVGGVALQLQTAGGLLPDYFADACYLHDIGYAPEATVTGFHTIDGALYLRSAGFSDPLVTLVAYHTGAEFEARERGLAADLGDFERPDQDLIDAITLCDLTTGPDGERVSPVARIDEILKRYSDEHPVHRAIRQSRPYLMECCHRAQARLVLPDVWLGASLKEVANA